MAETRIGFAVTGSFCTFARVFPQMQLLAEKGYRVIPIMSECAYTTDTRFGLAKDWIRRAEEITGEPVIHTIAQAEPIGPKKLLDLLVIAPCTGNTLGKLACGIYDTAPTLAVKSHRRNDRPVLIAVSTNDALAFSAASIGALMVPSARTIPAGSPVPWWQIFPFCRKRSPPLWTAGSCSR